MAFQNITELLPVAFLVGLGVIIALIIYLQYKAQTAFVQNCSRKLNSDILKIRQEALEDIRNEMIAHLKVGRTKKAGARHVVTLLLTALRDNDSRIRQGAAALLSSQIDEHAIISSGEEVSAFWLSEPVVQLMGAPFIRAVKDPYPPVRKEAVIALGKIYNRIRDTRVIPPILNALKDPEENIRKRAAIVLRTIADLRSIPPLLEAMAVKDESEIVRQPVLYALETICQSVYVIVFGNRKASGDSEERDIVRNLDVELLPFPMKNLQQIVIDTTTCDISQVEAFATYATTYLDPEDLKDYVKITIYGDPFVFSPDVYSLCHLCKDVDVATDTIVFGEIPLTDNSARYPAYNPDLTTFSLRMPSLRQVIIHTETYNFHHVERFLTYAVNYIGQDVLHENVEVHLYGDPKKLHPNLQNSLTHLCKTVYEHL